MKKLLALKADFKSVSGKDWKPGMTFDSPPAAATAASASTGGDSSSAAVLNDKITAQGNKVRDLKAAKADKVFDVVTSCHCCAIYF